MLYDCERFFPKTTEFSFTGSPGDPLSVAKIGFVVPSGVVLEGDSAVVSILGGNADSASSVKVYLAYNTAAAANKQLWLEVCVPNQSDAFFVIAQPPQEIPMPEIGQNELLTVTISMTVVEYKGWDTKVSF